MDRIIMLGKKVGMTHVYDDSATLLPVTVISFSENIISGLRTKEKNSYNSLVVSTNPVKEKKLNKCQVGAFKKNNIDGFYANTFEVRVSNIDEKYTISSSLSLDMFKINDKVDVTSISKGKGFAGTVKRYGFKMQDATHGNSKAHRAPGSTGQRQTPGRVFKGKKMAGHMGNTSVTIEKLTVVQVDMEKQLLVLKGSVPGGPNSWVKVKPSLARIKKNKSIG